MRCTESQYLPTTHLDNTTATTAMPLPRTAACSLLTRVVSGSTTTTSASPAAAAAAAAVRASSFSTVSTTPPPSSSSSPSPSFISSPPFCSTLSSNSITRSTISMSTRCYSSVPCRETAARLMTSSSSSSSSSSSPPSGFWGGLPPGVSPHLMDDDPSSSSSVPLLPPRQVPDAVLRFTTVAYLDSSAYIPFPHKDGIDARAFPTNPANFKVTMQVSIKDLSLSEREQKRLRCLVGSRYNPGRGDITLVSGRFMNRDHNKQYLIYLLENLVSEAQGKGSANGSV